MAADKTKKAKVGEPEPVDGELVLNIEKLQEIEEELKKVFKFMHSIEVDDFKDEKMGYSITFNFTENPYFEDKKLTKSYAFADKGTTNIFGTKIRWKEGMDLLANGNVQEKKGSKRPFVEESFFSWFNENLQENLSGVMDEVADIIKEDLWPDPLTYFNNEIDEDDFDSEDDDEETDEDGDDDDDDDDDGEDDD